MSKKIALISGANKGLGFEISKQLAALGIAVVLTARDEKKGQAAADEIQKTGADAVFCPMNVTDPAGIEAAVNFVSKKFGRLDILVNNAGIMKEEDMQTSPLTLRPEVVLETFQTNTLGHIRVTQAFLPLMKKNDYGRIVNMSSGLGTLTDMAGSYLAYRISKTALNAFTRIFAKELEGTNILINSMCPGWCRTDMGGPNADRSPEQGAKTAVYLATLPDGGPAGKYFRDEKEIAW